MIERWSNPDGSQDYLWSVWRDGKRLQVGGRFESAEAAETAARRFCLTTLGADADRVRSL